ncbi:hypothetical protein [Paenibacillus sp. YPG26]|uniref:hypothetical protein n=1 Tax=Paenibacillus sp. YPG26 TaxID=2878915 RepID=UPI002041451D|nr:hypothetical protein [Paenibacillus sp. YPG26]USB33402.1 hypothetical protein LDO05_00720 [Paenibacillus sp. YPG26]
MNENKTHAFNDLPAGLAKPAIRALTHAGLLNLEQISRRSENEIKQLHGIGPNALKLIRAALENKGLAFSEDK